MASKTKGQFVSVGFITNFNFVMLAVMGSTSVMLLFYDFDKTPFTPIVL